jgi:hypothetical protein
MEVGMVTPSRTKSEHALLTVRPQELMLALPGEHHEFVVPFDAAGFSPDRPGADTRPNAVEEQGRALWTAAFSGLLGPLLDRAAAQANDGGAFLMLRIVPAPNLQQAGVRWLPWETLFDPARRDFLALTTGWSVVRGVAPFRPGRALRDHDLQVLVLALGGSTARAAEVEAVRAVVGGAGEVSVAHPSDPGEAVAVLASTSANIVHVLGRGRGEGLLIGSGGTEQHLDGRDVAAAVAKNTGIGLLVLSASATELVAEVVARRTSVTVLGHRDGVRAEHALRLTEVFYRRLLDGIPADAALTEARRALDRRFPGQGAWASAVLVTSPVPPRLPGRPAPEAGPPDRLMTAAQLIEQLHRTNRNRILELQQVAAWKLLDAQLAQADRALAAPGAGQAP